MYYCIVVEGIDIEKVDKSNKNAFIYACEYNRVEMLKMMIDVF